MTAPSLTVTGPSSPQPSLDFDFEFTFTKDSETHARLASYVIEVYGHNPDTHEDPPAFGGEQRRWVRTFPASAASMQADAFAVPVPAYLMRLSDFGELTLCFRALARDERGISTEWTALETMSVEFPAPTLTVGTPNGLSLPALGGVRFVASSSGLTAFVQMQVQAEGGDWSDLLWDSGRRPSLSKLQPTIMYGGPRLTVETYEYRLRAWDDNAKVSDWVEGSFDLTGTSTNDVTP